MILTVKLGNVDYKTMAIDLDIKGDVDDQGYLDAINVLVRERIWKEFSNYDRVRYQNKIENMPPIPIVMMYSRNRHSYTD